VKPAPFEYRRARSVDEAVAWLREDPEAKLLAGGQSLVPMMNMRLVRPSRLVDINAIPSLDTITPLGDGGLAIGALARHHDLATAPPVRERAPLLATAAAHVGHRAIRNRGTLGGSLAHADPAAELPAALVALDAVIIATGPRGSRRIAADAFFVGLLATALAPDEILIGVEIPAQRGAGWGFAEVARRAGDFAIAGVAGVLLPDGTAGGRSMRARLVAFGAGDRPVRLTAAESILAGAPVAPGGAAWIAPETANRAASGGASDAARDVATRAGTAAAGACSPSDDVHASADYRRHLVGVLTEEVVGDAWGRLAAAATALDRR
jgi:carbon-monoxide dehydrogenase medium subunit